MAENYPLAATQAAQMLREAINKCGLSQREIARRLGYKSSVVVSHMASGRAPIPIDRAADIANEVGLDRGTFLAAVLKQRHPDLDFGWANQAADAPLREPDGLLSELELLAGAPLADLPAAHLDIIREVIASRDPTARWLKVSEVQAMDLVRRRFPDIGERGLTAPQLSTLERCLGRG